MFLAKYVVGLGRDCQFYCIFLPPKIVLYDNFRTTTDSRTKRKAASGAETLQQQKTAPCRQKPESWTTLWSATVRFGPKGMAKKKKWSPRLKFMTASRAAVHLKVVSTSKHSFFVENKLPCQHGTDSTPSASKINYPLLLDPILHWTRVGVFLQQMKSTRGTIYQTRNGLLSAAENLMSLDPGSALVGRHPPNCRVITTWKKHTHKHLFIDIRSI